MIPWCRLFYDDLDRCNHGGSKNYAVVLEKLVSRGLVDTTYAHYVGICEFESKQEYIILLISVVAGSVRT